MFYRLATEPTPATDQQALGSIGFVVASHLPAWSAPDHLLLPSVRLNRSQSRMAHILGKKYGLNLLGFEQVSSMDFNTFWSGLLLQ